MNQIANDNFRPATAGQNFCPEMGERHDGTALFHAKYGWKDYLLKWAPARHEEALLALRSLKVRPNNVEIFETVKGEKKGRCTVTVAAFRKVLSAKLAVLEVALD